jgi:oxygen-independent coproporphyrinogen-3 oxidase
LIDDFVPALLKEIAATSAENIQHLGPLKTLYFGGGTPSLLSIKDVSAILKEIQSVFDTTLIEEVTFEINPENAELYYLNELKKLGVNRLSMGVQSFHPHILRSMHRSHTKKQALKAIELIKKAGFDSFNIDLIYAYPGESIEELKSDLRTFIELDPPHISAYSLTVENGTRLKKLIENDKMQELDEDSQAEHFDLVSTTLKGAGFMHYETSNFAKPSQESKHNSNYWSHKNYLGFGPAAHSFLWGNKNLTAERWASPSDLTSYIEKKGKLQREELKSLSISELAEERLMLALRTKEGLHIPDWEKRYQTKLTVAQCNLINEWLIEAYIDKKAWQQNKLLLSDKTFVIADHMVYKLITA